MSFGSIAGVLAATYAAVKSGKKVSKDGKKATRKILKRVKDGRRRRS